MACIFSKKIAPILSLHSISLKKIAKPGDLPKICSIAITNFSNGIVQVAETTTEVIL